MKAIAIQEFGSPDGLAVIDTAPPSPAEGQVRIDVEAIGVGGVDALIRSGALAAHGFRKGHILGGEIAGTVTAVGPEVDSSWVGRRVWAFTGLGGGYVEQSVAPVEAVVPIPGDVTAVDAVTVGTSGVVAHFALRHARLAPGERVLVRGAAGSLGTLAVQLAVRAGAGEIAVTTSSADRGARLRTLGATRVLDRAGDDPVGGPVRHDVIIDIVAGPDLPGFLERLEPNGRMVAVGVMAGDPPPEFGTRLFAAFRKSLSFATFSADTVDLPDRLAVTAELFAAVARGEIRAVVHEVLPLEQARTAHRHMDAGEVFGRLVLVP